MPKEFRGAVEADLTNIAERIKKQCQKKNFTQEQFAEVLNIEPTTLQAIEQKRGRPSLELLLTIVKALGMKLTLK